MSKDSAAAGGGSMPAANQTKTEPIPVSEHESAPSSGTVSGNEPQAPTKKSADGSSQTEPEQ